VNTIFYTFSISLFDSLMTSQQIIIFALLLSTARPLRNTLSYLAGLSGAYFICGIGGYLTLDQLRILLAKLFPFATNMSNPSYYKTEFFMGLLMVAFGAWYFFKNKTSKFGRAENMMLMKLRTINSMFAFYAGVFISVTSFPFSIPYLIALGRYSTLHLALPQVAGYILLYNIGYALPMILIFFVYLIARKGSENYHDIMHEKTKKLNVQLTTWTLVGFGLFSMIDAGCYFAIGHALIKGRYF